MPKGPRLAFVEVCVNGATRHAPKRWRPMLLLSAISGTKCRTTPYTVVTPPRAAYPATPHGLCRQAGEEDQNENTNERSPVAPKTPKRCKPPTTPAASLVKAFGSLSLNTPRATQTRYHTRSSARKANKLVDSVVVSTLRDSSNNHQDSGVQITTAAAGAKPPGSHIPAPPLAETDDGELVAARLGDTTSEAATPTVRNLDVSVSPPRSPNVYPLEPDTAIRPVQKPSLLELPADKEGASQAKQLFSSSPTTIANATVQETPSSLEAAVEGQNDPANDEAAGEGEGYKEELEVKSRGLPECAKDSAPRPSVAVTAGGGSDSAARDAATADVDVAGANVIAGVASATAAVTPSHLIAAKDGAKSACVKLFTDNPEQDEAEQVEGRGTQSHRNGNAAVGGMGSHEGMDGDDTVIHIEGDETTGRSASSAECEEDPVTFNVRHRGTGALAQNYARAAPSSPSVTSDSTSFGEYERVPELRRERNSRDV